MMTETPGAMRRLTRLSTVLALAATGAQAATPDLSGNWVVAIQATEISNGTPAYYRLTLHQDGSALSGTLQDTPVSGSIEANGDFQLQTRWQTWTGSVQGNELVATTTSTDPSRHLLSTRATREKTPPTEARTHTFEPTDFHRLFAHDIPPVLHIWPGDTVETQTIDALGIDADGNRPSMGGNPQTGPFFVEGALPGDTLAIHLLSLEPSRDTATTTNTILPNAVETGFFAQLEDFEYALVTWNLDRAAGTATLDNPTDALKDYTVELKPFLGAIGVAPAQGEAIRTTHSGAYGGNLDYNRLVEGTTLYLPVFHPGALLFLGDGHAAQGDGELAGNALETSFDVTFRVDVIRAAPLRMPRAESAEALMASGIAGSLDAALRSATTNMSRWLQETYALDRYELSSVLNTAIYYDIAEIVGTEVHVVARLHKDVLERIAAQPR